MLIATVTGNVGSSELKDIKGQALLEFSIASNEKDRDGNDATTWVRCSLWAKRATALAPYVVKGTNLTVVGKLSVREFTKKSGEHGFSLEMAVSELALQGGKRDGASSGQRRERPAQDSHSAAKADGFAPSDDEYGTAEDSTDLPF